MKTSRAVASPWGGKTTNFALNTRTMKFTLFVFALGWLILPAMATGTQDLNSLEMHFFEHTYAQDTTEDRLTRLEKMVFGEARSGDNQSRLQQLVNALPAPQPSDPGSTSQTAANQNSQTPGADPANSSGNSEGDDASDTSSGTDYPRVTHLESALLGKTYQGEPIKHRLDQLELKAFGKTHSSEDLADRVDRIAQYADRKFNGKQSSTWAQSEPVNGSVEQKVAWLETQIEGQTFPQKPMIERLRPLEQAMFPTDTTDIHASIPEQVNMLMSAVELLHKQQTGQASGDDEVNIAPLVQQPQRQQQTGYARQTDLQREFEDDNGPAPTANYSPNYRPQQSYQTAGQPSYTQSQGYSGQPQYSQQTQSANNAQTHHGHPFFRGLAKALGEVGAMVGTSVMQGGMMGGYGMPNYGYGGVPGGAVFGFP